MVPESPHNDGSRPAILLGGHRDGEKCDVGLEDKTIFTFDAPAPYWGNGASPSPPLNTFITTYERVAVTPGGVAIFEEQQPREVSTTLEIEVVHSRGTAPRMVRGLAAEYVTRIACDHRAFPAGITAARLKDS